MLIEVADPETLRDDPVIARGYQALAIRVFASALEDLSSSEHAAGAWEFLLTDPDEAPESLFAHWYGYLKETTSLAAIRRTASRARSLAAQGRPYIAATIWRSGAHADASDE